MTRSLSNDTTTTVQGTTTVVGGGGGGGGVEVLGSGTGNALTVFGDVDAQGNVYAGNVHAKFYYGSGQFLSGVSTGGSVSGELVVANVVYGSNVLSVGNAVTGNGVTLFANGLGLYGNAVTGLIRVVPTVGLRLDQNNFAGALLEKRVTVADRYGLSTEATGTVRVHGSGAAQNNRVALAFAKSDGTFQDGLVVQRRTDTVANVGINTADPQSALDVLGNVTVRGGNVTVQQGVHAQFFYGSGQFLTDLPSGGGGGGGGSVTSSELVVANVVNGSNVLSVGNAVTGNGVTLFANGLGLYGNAITGLIRVVPTVGLRLDQDNFAGALLEKRVNNSNTDRFGLSTVDKTVRVHTSSVGTGSGANGPKVALAFATGDSTFQEGLTVIRDPNNAALADVGINTSTPEDNLHVVGNVKVAGHIVASGDVTAFSDATLKANLLQIANPLTKAREMTGYTFERVDMPSSRRFAGLLAQDVQTVLPEAVHVLSDGTLGVSYGSLSALFVESLKQLERRVIALEAAVAAAGSGASGAGP
jgi:hypothetical protein